MSFLKDKEWENMDWLNRAVEPYTFSLNAEFAKLPSQYTLTPYEIENFVNKGYSSISVSDVIAQMSDRHSLTNNGKQLLQQFGYSKLFKFHIEENSALDVQSGTLIGGITLIKKSESITEEMIKDFLDTETLRYLSLDYREIKSTHINEVMDIFECTEARISSSVRRKLAALKIHIRDAIVENKLNIRNVDLAVNLLFWIKTYLLHGDRGSIANISKLKCMTHNNHPIYSMEVVK